MPLSKYVDSLDGVAKSRYFNKLKVLGLAATDDPYASGAAVTSRTPCDYGRLSSSATFSVTSSSTLEFTFYPRTMQIYVTCERVSCSVVWTHNHYVMLHMKYRHYTWGKGWYYHRDTLSTYDRLVSLMLAPIIILRFLLTQSSSSQQCRYNTSET